MLAVCPKHNLVDFTSDEYAQHVNQFSTFYDRVPEVSALEFPLNHPKNITINQSFIRKCYNRKTR